MEISSNNKRGGGGGIQERMGSIIIPIPGIFNTWNNAGIFTLVALSALATFITLDLYLCYFVTSFPHGTMLPISVNTLQNPCYSSPYCLTTVKSLMIDPPDYYLHTPGSILFVNWLDLANSFHFITANMISIFHVLVALFASKLITNDSICVRRIGVLLFQLRNFLDGVDGVLGKERRKMAAAISESSHPSNYYNNNFKMLWSHDSNFTTTHSLTTAREIIYATRFSTSISSTSLLQDKIDLESSAKIGYWIDGICDGLGSSFLFLACYFYLQKHPVRNRSLFAYTSLPLVIASRNNGSIPSSKDRIKSSNSSCSSSSSIHLGSQSSNKKNWTRQISRTINRSGFLAILYGFQALFGTITWNRFILHYTKLLESTGSLNETTQEKRVKANLIRSPVMWIVILAWRYVNPHTWIEIILMAIFFDRMGELVHAFKLRGFLIVLIAAVVTEIHLQYAQYLI